MAHARSEIEQYIKDKHVRYYEYNEFNKIEEIDNGLVSKVYKANWIQGEKYLTLKSFNNLDDSIVKEIVNEIELYRKVDFNDVIIKLYGITKTDLEYFLVTEYADGGTLCDYLGKNFSSLNWEDRYRLALQLSSAIECLHENDIAHNDLHSGNVLVHQNSIKLVDFGLNKRIKNIKQTLLSTSKAPYIDPQTIRKEPSDMNSSGEKQIDQFKKGDVYSIGVLFWELSSGRKPFAGREYDSSLAVKIAQGLRESVVEGTPKVYSNLFAKCWNGDPYKRPTIQEVVSTLTSMASKQIIRKFKLNHGLFLDGYKIGPSKQAALYEDGILNICLYKGKPSVYTFINDHRSHVNLLSFTNDNVNFIELNEDLQPADLCINFPIAEITYEADLSETFTRFMNDEKDLNEIYGHLFARKILVGGKLFIDGIESATSAEINSFKSLLAWVYDSAKYNKKIPFNNLTAFKFFPIRTSDGTILISFDELTSWMNSLYQKGMAGIVSYDDLIPISQLNFGTPSSVGEKQPGIVNFKEKLNLDEWVKSSVNVKLTRWIKDFRLFHGLIINNHFELDISKKIAINSINIPDVCSNVKSYMEMIESETLEEFLISNNAFSVEVAKDVNSFPFIKRTTKSTDDLNYRDYTHCRLKHERYTISLNKDGVKSSEGFKQAIEKALKSMKPFLHLQDVFDEYGHCFPLRIVLGKSLKSILPNFTLTSEDILGEKELSPSIDSLKPHLDNLNIVRLLTQKGHIIENNEEDLHAWIENINNDLEIIEFDQIIPLYKILEVDQRRKIDNILDAQNNFKIIMTGIVELKDFDISDTGHYKRINIEPSFEAENYEVFGSIILKKNERVEDFLVTFKACDFNGFSATIKSLKNTDVNITECYLLWMIIGKPSLLSVFSPNNRDCQVKESVVLRPNNSNFSIKTSCQLSEGCAISINTYYPESNDVPVNIKLVGWLKDRIDLQVNPIIDHIEVRVCILSSNSRTLRIDNVKGECSLNLIGSILTKDNFLKASSLGHKKKFILSSAMDKDEGPSNNPINIKREGANKKFYAKHEEDNRKDLNLSKKIKISGREEEQEPIIKVENSAMDEDDHSSIDEIYQKFDAKYKKDSKNFLSLLREIEHQEPVESIMDEDDHSSNNPIDIKNEVCKEFDAKASKYEEDSQKFLNLSENIRTSEREEHQEMPGSKLYRSKRWTDQETINALKIIDENFSLWQENRSAACDKAAEAVPDRDSKSVYNKVHNMIKISETMDDNNKKKQNDPIWGNKEILNLLRKIKTGEENERGEDKEPIINVIKVKNATDTDDRPSNDPVDVEKEVAFKKFNAIYKEYRELKRDRCELKELEEKVASTKKIKKEREGKYKILKQLFEDE